MHTGPRCSVYWKNTIAVGLESGDITILDGTTGSQVAILSGHIWEVNSLDVLSDVALLVSGSKDHTIKQWDLQTGGVIKTLHGHTGSVLSVSISADHATIASVSSDATLRLWDIWTGECHHIIKQKDQAQCVRFSPTDPQHIILASLRNVQQWEVGGHGINHTYDGCYATFSPDGTQFASYVARTKIVVVRNSGSGAIVAEFPVECKPNMECCCFSPNGRLVAVTADNAIHIWDITGSAPQLIETFVGHHGIIYSIVFSSPSSLISSSRDCTVKFWQITVPSTDKVATLTNTTPLTRVLTGFITLQVEDGITISGGLDGVVKIWDLSTGICKASFQTPAKYAHLIDVRLIDDRLIFVWLVNEKIHIYDVKREDLLHTMDSIQSFVRDIRISGDGSKVLCLDGGTIQAWSIWTGEVVGKVIHNILNPRSLIVDGSSTWVRSLSIIRGWDFGVTNSPPVSLSNSPLLYLSDTKEWDIGLSRVRDTVTGQVIFQMGGRYKNLVDVQSGGKYVAIRYESWGVLILDFSHVLP